MILSDRQQGDGGGGGEGLVLFQETKVEGMGDISSFPSGLF